MPISKNVDTNWGNSDMLMEFLTDYLLFKDVKYLQPIELSLELVRRSGEIKDRPKEVGSERWVAYTLINSGVFWEVAELWRLFTGNMKYDDLLKARGSAYVRFRLTGDEQPLRDDLAALLKDVAGSYELITSEGYFTDRIELRNLRSRDERGAGILESMYLGAPLVDLFYPFSPVFWKGFDTTFSALVLQAAPRGAARLRRSPSVRFR